MPLELSLASALRSRSRENDANGAIFSKHGETPSPPPPPLLLLDKRAPRTMHACMRGYVRIDAYASGRVTYQGGFLPLINSRSCWSRAPINDGGLISENGTRSDSSIELNCRSNRSSIVHFMCATCVGEKFPLGVIYLILPISRARRDKLRILLTWLKMKDRFRGFTDCYFDL